MDRSISSPTMPPLLGGNPLSTMPVFGGMYENMDRSRLVSLIITVVRDIHDPSGTAGNLAVDENTWLFGRDGLFDSVGLVSVILAVEQDVSNATGRAITIADERAMSRTRSPFLTVGSLATYTAELLREAGVPEDG